MITDNASWILFMSRNPKAFFVKVINGGKVHLLAANRAARRLLHSNTVVNMAIEKGAKIEDGGIS